MDTETTPLLPIRRRTSDEVLSTPILPVVQSLDTADLAHLRWEDLSPSPPPVTFETNECMRLAFALIVLLELRRERIIWRSKYSDVYEQWTEEKARMHDVQTLERKINELWERFLDQYHNPREFYDVLWMQFPHSYQSSAVIRVVDFLLDSDSPRSFVAHPVVAMTMTRTWRYGQPEGDSAENWLSKYVRMNATPFKIHMLDLIFDLIYLFLLLSYVINPPDSDFMGTREFCILLYSFSVVLSGQGYTVFTSACILVAFALGFRPLPMPGTISFSIVLWVIFLRLAMYHISTVHPGPLPLFAHQRSFPLSVFLMKGLTRIIRPLFLFYFPTALVASLALSISLSGPLSGPLASYIYSYPLTLLFIPGEPGSPMLGIAPMETRVMFLVFSIAVLLFSICSAYILGTSTPVAQPRPVIRTYSSSPMFWNFYSPDIGHCARIASYKATMIYARKHSFPPPFNIIEMLLVSLPVALVYCFGYHEVSRSSVAKLVWSIAVQPFVAIVTLICWPIV